MVYWMKRFYCVYSYECNDRCINCCLDKETEKVNKKLSFPDMKGYLETFSINKNDIFEMSGGEPTIDKEFISHLLKYISDEKGFNRNRINILSNCENFSDKDFTDQISKYFGHITSTFYRYNQIDQDVFTQIPGSFNNKINGLNNLHDNDVKLHIKTIINRKNYRELEQFIDLCSTNFSDSHIIMGWLCLIGEAWKNRDDLALEISKAGPYIENAIDKAREIGLNLTLTLPLCCVDPYYWKGHMPGDLTYELEKVIFINPEVGIEEKSPEEVPLFNKPSKKCDLCLLKYQCVWEWEGYENYLDIDNMVNPITDGI